MYMMTLESTSKSIMFVGRGQGGMSPDLPSDCCLKSCMNSWWC